MSPAYFESIRENQPTIPETSAEVGTYLVSVSWIVQIIMLRRSIIYCSYPKVNCKNEQNLIHIRFPQWFFKWVMAIVFLKSST